MSSKLKDKFVLNNDNDPFQALTGKKRSYMAETEHERQAAGVDAVAPTGPNNHKELDAFHSNMNDCIINDVMNLAINDKFKDEIKKRKQAEGCDSDDDHDDGFGYGKKSKDDENAHEDDYDGKCVDDDDLEKIRARRMEKMREMQKKKMEYKANGHGEYGEIKEEEFLTTVTKSHRTIVHFYHKSFESCKVMDMHLTKMSKKFFGTRFVFLEAEKAPFFVSKLSIQTIPTTCFFIDGVLVYKQLGFAGIEGGQSNEIRTGHLARVMRGFNCIEEDFDSEDDM